MEERIVERDGRQKGEWWRKIVGKNGWRRSIEDGDGGEGYEVEGEREKGRERE